MLEADLSPKQENDTDPSGPSRTSDPDDVMNTVSSEKVKELSPFNDTILKDVGRE